MNFLIVAGEYNTASEALVAWAKQNQSDDNISVIVVFLTPPAEIAAKRYFSPRNNLQPVSMEQSGGMEHESQQRPYDFDFGFGKVPTTGAPAPNSQTNGEDLMAGLNFGNAGLEPVNGKHRPKPPKYNDEDDDDDEEEEDDEDADEEDDDLGPETNVDVLDDSQHFVKMDPSPTLGQPRNLAQEFFCEPNAKIPDDEAEFPPELKGEFCFFTTWTPILLSEL